ncbi:MAG: YraN family protein [Bryobacteraceae bacterium]
MLRRDEHSSRPAALNPRIPAQALAWLLGRIDALRAFASRGRGTPRRALGRRAEDLVHRYLQQHGYRILARNWTGPRLAEVDIVAADGDRTVFVEVKSRQGDEHGSPERALDMVKRIAQRRAARAWARGARIDVRAIRFDLVTVVFTDPPRIEHQPDAWPLEGGRV